MRILEYPTMLHARFSGPAEEISTAGRAPTGVKERVLSTVFATVSPLL